MQVVDVDLDVASAAEVAVIAGSVLSAGVFVRKFRQVQLYAFANCTQKFPDLLAVLFHHFRIERANVIEISGAIFWCEDSRVSSVRVAALAPSRRSCRPGALIDFGTKTYQCLPPDLREGESETCSLAFRLRT